MAVVLVNILTNSIASRGIVLEVAIELNNNQPMAVKPMTTKLMPELMPDNDCIFWPAASFVESSRVKSNEFSYLIGHFPLH